MSWTKIAVEIGKLLPDEEERRRLLTMALEQDAMNLSFERQCIAIIRQIEQIRNEQRGEQ